MRCDECKWWLPSQRAKLIGECRRNAPQPADNMQDPRWWPHTHRHDWCGEFARRDTEEGGEG